MLTGGEMGSDVAASPCEPDEADNPRHLVSVPAEHNPGTDEQGQLAPLLAEEPEPACDGLLSSEILQPQPTAKSELLRPPIQPVPSFHLSDAERQGIIDRLIRREGGYVNDPSDKGGRTNYGITRVAIEDYNRLMKAEGGAPLEKTPAAISRPEAEAVYRKMMKAYRFDQIQDQPLREHIFDMAVNHGPVRAVMLLQEVFHRNGYPVAVDGVLGPKTRGILNELASKPEAKRRLNNNLVKHREDFYHRLIRRNPIQKKFEKGWLDRARSFLLLPPSHH